MKQTKAFFLTLVLFFSTFSASAKISNNGINYEYLQNSGKPVLILSHPFASDLIIWNDIVPLLKKDFSILVYDLRGQGKSEVTNKPYTLQVFGNDVIELMDQLQIKEAYFCGSSISGFIAQWLAVNHSDRIKKIIISNAGYSTQDADSQKFFKDQQNKLYNNQPQEWIDFLFSVYFNDNFKKNHKKRYIQMKKIIQNSNPQGMANGLAATLEFDFTDQLEKITIPALIIEGKNDKTFDVVAVGNFMHQKIPGSQLKILPGGHANFVEYPKQYAKEVKKFLIK